MKAFVVRDGHFSISKDGPSSKIVSYDNFSSRYLVAFDEVVLIGRLFDAVELGSKPVIGKGVTFLPIKGYKGPVGFLKNLIKILILTFGETKANSAYILRLPATIPLMFGLVLKLKNIPYAVEVVGDPYDAYSPEVLNNPFAKFFQFVFTKITKFVVYHSSASAYVTAFTLQSSYPSKRTKNSFSYTSLDLPDFGFVTKSRGIELFRKTSFSISHVGMMQQNYKGHDTLLEALSLLRSRGLDVKLDFVGDGSLIENYRRMAIQLNIHNHVKFHGLKSAGTEVWDILDCSDIFVLPSRQEGLPRALIEAMARGLPCLGTSVGGVPELLKSEYMISPGDALGLANKIEHVLSNPSLLAEMSKENLDTSQKYNIKIVKKARDKFYKLVKDMSI